MNRRALMAAALAPLAARVATASAQRGDTGVLGGLLAIEQAQVAFYERAAGLPFHGPVAELAGRIGDEERKHAERLRALGAKPPPGAAPQIHFGKRDEFLRLAQRLEGLAVGAYNGAVTALRDTELIQVTASIAQVEARHSAAVRWLRQGEPAPRAVDRAFASDRAQHALQTLLGG
jgi:rubrerythrin